jgi:hypothetical protein
MATKVGERAYQGPTNPRRSSVLDLWLSPASTIQGVMFETDLTNDLDRTAQIREKNRRWGSGLTGAMYSSVPTNELVDATGCA